MRSNEALLLAGGTLAAGVALAEAQLRTVVIHMHGKAHKANGESPFASALGDVATYALGTDSHVWIGPHVNSVDTVMDGEERKLGIGHHALSDFSGTAAYQYAVLKRAYRLYPRRYENHPDLADGIAHPNFDPYANLYKSEILRIGSFMMAIMQGLLKEDHIMPTDISVERAKQIIDTTKPKYLYQRLKRYPKDHQYTVEELAELLLNDTYSPSLYPVDDKVKNGVRGIWLHNVSCFRRQADVYKGNEALLDQWIRDIPIVTPDNGKGLAILFGGLSLLGAGAGIAKHGLRPEALLYALAAASAAGISVEGPVKGGAGTNALGHMGDVEDIIKALEAMFFNEPYELVPNSDGSAMSVVRPKDHKQELIVRGLNRISKGEIFGQFWHHGLPHQRFYAHTHSEARTENRPTYNIHNASRRKHGRFGIRPDYGHPVDQFGYRLDDTSPVLQEIVWPARVRTRLQQAA